MRKYQDLSDNVGLVMVRQVIATLKQPHFYSGRARKGTPCAQGSLICRRSQDSV